MATKLEYFTAQIEKGTYQLGETTKTLSTQAKDFLEGYTAAIRNSNGKIIPKLEEYAATLGKAGTIVKEDVIKESQNFMANTKTGQAVSEWGGKIYDAAHDTATKGGNVVSNNRWGMLAGFGSMLAMMALKLPMLMAIPLGLAIGAAANYFGDNNGFVNDALGNDKKPATTPSAKKEDEVKAGQDKPKAKTAEELAKEARKAAGGKVPAPEEAKEAPAQSTPAKPAPGKNPPAEAPTP